MGDYDMYELKHLQSYSIATLLFHFTQSMYVQVYIHLVVYHVQCTYICMP